MYCSSSTNDDKWWYPIGTTDFNDASNAFPDTLFVGPTYGCENGNILGQYDTYTGPDLTGYFVARFVNYSAVPQKPRGTATYAIGLNFGNGYATTEPGNVGNESTGTLLSSNDIAGVSQVAQGNWNNLFGDATNATGLVAENENTGAATQFTNILVGWASPNLWTTAGPGSDNTAMGGGTSTGFSGEDAVLMTGYLDIGSAGTTDVGITNIPPEMVSQGYDVIVYTLSSVNGRGGAIGIYDTNLNIIPGQGLFAVQTPATNPTGFVQALPETALSTNATTVTSWSSGDYLVFTNLKASAIVVQSTTVAPFGFSGTPRVPINAIQLISPSGLASGGTGPVGTQPAISVSGHVITYTGVLRSSPTVGGTYTAVAGATSPYTIPGNSGTVFYVATSQ
jgi:hypothetical protein